MRPRLLSSGSSGWRGRPTRAFWQRPLITLTRGATFRTFGCFVRQRLEAENPMSYVSLNNLLATAKLATPEQFEEWRKAWQVSASNGSTESLLEFICRESRVSEEIFLQQLAGTLGWPVIDFRKVTVPTETRNKIFTKGAFQYNAPPGDFPNPTL